MVNLTRPMPPPKTTGRKPEQDINSWLESFHELDFPISAPILVEGMGLLLENMEYSIGREGRRQAVTSGKSKIS